MSQSSISSKYDNEANTSSRPCPWCKADVYYHTNGYGDSVYFDSLGYPWQVHGCFKDYWEARKPAKPSHAMQSSLSRSQDFFEVDVNEQKRLVLIGSAHQTQSVKVETSFVYGITEEALAKQMGISIASLRAIYGHLYFCKSNGIEFSTDDQKRLKLLDAAHRIPSATVGEFLVYGATELSLAQQMGISVEQLKKFYGHLYEQEHIGIKIFAEQELECRRKARIKTKFSKKSRIPSQTLKQKHNIVQIKQGKHHNEATSVKSVSTKQIVLCPYCETPVRNDRLEKHVYRKCYANRKDG